MTSGRRTLCNLQLIAGKNRDMKRSFAATVLPEGNWYISQCLEVDIASQGETEEEALANLKEALGLHFEPSQATRPPQRSAPSRLRLGRLSPQPFREIKRLLEAAGFVEASQKAATSSSSGVPGQPVDTPLCRKSTKFRWALYGAF